MIPVRASEIPLIAHSRWRCIPQTATSKCSTIVLHRSYRPFSDLDAAYHLFGLRQALSAARRGSGQEPARYALRRYCGGCGSPSRADPNDRCRRGQTP